MAFKKTVLNNGLRIISESVRGFRSVSVGLWAEVGSRNETKERGGISHFLEHMVFKGTKKRTPQQIALSLESLGGSLNAFTGREQTCYYARILDEHLPQAMDVLSDILVNPKLSARDMEKERRVICEEIKDVEDAPSDYLHDLFCENLWVDHPIGRPIMGTVKSVNAITRKDLISHMRANYSPENIIVAAAGKVDHDQLVKLARRHCRFNHNNGTRPDPIAPTTAMRRNQAFHRDLNQAHVCIGVRATPFLDQRRHILLVLNNLLGGGMSSRLFQSVREKRGLVYTIYAFHDFFKDSGLFAIYFGTMPEQTVEAADLVFEEFRKVKKQPIPSKLLDDVKNQIKGNLMMGLESTPNRMHRIARHEIFTGKYIPVKQTMAAIEQVTPKEVQEFANEIFVPDNMTVSMIGAVGDETISGLKWSKLN